jgi:ESS family glutamate:Na+ symporter
LKTINVDMYQTLAVAVGVLYLGGFLKKKVRFLETFCIPSPVIGGVIFAIISCVLHVAGIVEFQFDETLKTVCMVMFFTSVGFQANIKVLKAGGKSLIVFLLCLIVLIFAQNAVAVGLSKLLGVSSLVGMCTGSIPMVGGHGTSGAFGTVLEDLGQQGATRLKHDLMKTVIPEDDSILVEDEQKHHRSVSMYAPAAYQLAIAMGIGTFVSWVLSYSGMTFPVYIGSMIVAAFMRNIGEYSGKIHIHMGEINDIGGICLSLFLGIAMITLKLWQLAELALPMIIMLVAQVLLMAMFSCFIVYNVMGRNYDAAVLAAGTCGFGMGATPNAMANMQALTAKFAPSIKAYMLVPIVGSMFADFINSLVITGFINFIN